MKNYKIKPEKNFSIVLLYSFDPKNSIDTMNKELNHLIVLSLILEKRTDTMDKEIINLIVLSLNS